MNSAVIGGAGKMGQWITRFLLSEGIDVTVVDNDEKKLAVIEPRRGLELTTDINKVIRSDIVIFAVPLVNFENVVVDIAPLIQPGQLVFDIASIKKPMIDSMHQHIKNGTILGVHPMFGPGASGLSGQNIILTPTTDIEEKLADKVKAYLESRGARISIISPTKHDEIMSIVLGLPHFIAFITADTLNHLEVANDIEKYGGTTLKKLMEIVKGVVLEDPVFYSYLQMNLPNMPHIYSILQTRVDEWVQFISKGDIQQMADKMRNLEQDFIHKL